MKYTIRIAALAVLIPALIVVYSDLSESDQERLESVQTETPELMSQAASKSTPTFLYQDILENAVVQVEPVPEYRSTPKDPTKQYAKLIQVASFRSLQHAEQLKAQLIAKQMPNVQLLKSSQSNWYSITVGPFASRSLLNKAQDQLAQMKFQTQVLSVN